MLLAPNQKNLSVYQVKGPKKKKQAGKLTLEIFTERKIYHGGCIRKRKEGSGEFQMLFQRSDRIEIYKSKKPYKFLR